jgi:hypothetical protein
VIAVGQQAERERLLLREPGVALRIVERGKSDTMQQALCVFLVVHTLACTAEAPPPPATTVCEMGDTTCQRYLPIWRELVMKRSGVDAAYVDAHIQPLSAKAEKWNDGTSLRVRYTFELDWVVIEREDSFITFVDPAAAPDPALQVPLGRQLDAAEIERAVAGGGWASSITAIPGVAQLKFRSQDEALAVLQAHPDGAKLRTHEVSFNRPGMLPRDNGHPPLHARGTIDDD